MPLNLGAGWFQPALDSVSLILYGEGNINNIEMGMSAFLREGKGKEEKEKRKKHLLSCSFCK